MDDWRCRLINISTAGWLIKAFIVLQTFAFLNSSLSVADCGASGPAFSYLTFLSEMLYATAGTCGYSQAEWWPHFVSPGNPSIDLPELVQLASISHKCHFSVSVLALGKINRTTEDCTFDPRKYAWTSLYYLKIIKQQTNDATVDFFSGLTLLFIACFQLSSNHLVKFIESMTSLKFGIGAQKELLQLYYHFNYGQVLQSLSWFVIIYQ